MTTSAISDHIPDISVITYYAEKGETVFSRISPWTKLATLVLVILFITLTSSPAVLTGLFIAVLAVYVLAGLPLKKLAAWYVLPVIFVLSLVGIMAWLEPGTPVVSFTLLGMQVTLTDNGIILVVTLIMKALISITYTLFFLMTTRYEHFSGMVSRLLPFPADQVFLLSYRFLFLTFSMIGALLKAVRSRGGSLAHGIRKQAPLFAAVFGLIFIRSFERAERVRKAMDARGYSGSLASRVLIPLPNASEYGFLGFFIFLMALTNYYVPFTGW